MKKIILTMAAATAMTLSGAAQENNVIIPKPIQPGSKIAIVSPASVVKSEKIDSAVVKILDMGYQPVVFEHAKTADWGGYPAVDSIRAAELMSAFLDPEIDAILCARGGYGCVRLLPLLDLNVIRNNPKWLVGYSDISDLHALMHKAGVASIHGPMCGHIGEEPADDISTRYLFEILSGKLPMAYEIPAHPYDHFGEASGRLLGGNLLTINGLSETPYDVLNIGDQEDVILFIEDVGEKIYAIERVLMRLHQSGALSKVKGIVIGQFTSYKPDNNFETMEDMIYHWLKEWGYYDADSQIPIVFNFPTGHVTENYPMVCNSWSTLKVTPSGTTLTMADY